MNKEKKLPTAEEIAIKNGLYHSFTKEADDKALFAMEEHTRLQTAPLQARIKLLESQLDLTKLSDYEDYIKNINSINLENRKLKKDIKMLMSFANQIVRYTSTGKDFNYTMHNLAKEVIRTIGHPRKEEK